MKIALLSHRFFQTLQKEDWYEKVKPSFKGVLVDPKKFFAKKNSPFNVDYDRKNPNSKVFKRGWDGPTQTLYAPRKSEIMSLYHDLAHYLIADKSRLSLDDFGLYKGYQSQGLEYNYPSEYYVGLFEDSQFEEEIACYLSFCMAKADGVDDRIIVAEMKSVIMESITSLYPNTLKKKKVREHLKELHGVELILPNS